MTEKALHSISYINIVGEHYWNPVDRTPVLYPNVRSKPVDRTPVLYPNVRSKSLACLI